jgi:hypothetical protein
MHMCSVHPRCLCCGSMTGLECGLECMFARCASKSNMEECVGLFKTARKPLIHGRDSIAIPALPLLETHAHGFCVRWLLRCPGPLLCLVHNSQGKTRPPASKHQAAWSTITTPKERHTTYNIQHHERGATSWYSAPSTGIG